MNATELAKSSLAHVPDLDWSQIGETVRMLNLAIAQINASLKDGDESVDMLGNSFTAMAGGIKAIESLIEGLPKEVEDETKEGLTDMCAELANKTEAAIIAFQFYDKITQRLSHVCHSLDALSELVADRARLYHPYEWIALQNQIRSKFTLEIDRYMFDAMLKGASVEEAMQMAKQHFSEEDDGDIELF